jgi:hypothetical protein
MLSTPLLPIDDAQHHLQVLRYLRSSALMHLRDNTRAAERAADESGLVAHVLVPLPCSEDRLAIREGAPHTLPNRLRLFARERENVSQEGLDALVHWDWPQLAVFLDRAAGGGGPSTTRLV